MKKTLFTVLVLALICCFSCGVTADAAIYDYGTTRDCDYSVYVATVDGGVNLREAPTTESAILCLIPDFVQLRITMESTNGNGWGYTNYNGYHGWVALSQVSEYYPITETSYDVSVTASDGVNLREGPYTSYGKLTNIPHATVLHVEATYNGWGAVSYNGYYGWIALSQVGDVVEEEHEPMPIDEDAVESAPIEEDAAVTSLDKEKDGGVPLMAILLGMIVLVVVIAAVLIIIIIAKKK